MNILMFTNTFTPHVGGVARSVQGFTRAFRRRGHRVVVVAPQFEGMPATEADVVRLPAIRHFSGSDFSVPVPLPGRVSRALRELGPQVIHSHHPFLLGETALRVAAFRGLPVVFTHHTLYERYTHYLSGESPRLQRFAAELATGYGNLCDAVIAPSRSVADLLAERGVRVPVEVIPTGVDLGVFSPGEGGPLRRRLGVPPEAFVVGHVGRLAEEKNPLFLARAVARFLQEAPRAHFLLVGTGPAAEAMFGVFGQQGLEKRLHPLGTLGPVEAYRAMDVFAFASLSETQGMVLTEAMAAGVPVIAVDGPGVREVVCDGENGRLLPALDETGMARALAWAAGLAPERRGLLREAALRTAGDFSMERTAGRVLDLYRRLCAGRPRPKGAEAGSWAASLRFFGEEWKILRNLMHAVENALRVRENGKNADL
jgi:glycosyltransferase involved in cell wall biosynthesis